MSEYQFIHFLAIDRPLDEEQLEFMRGQSSRAEVSRWEFTNEYHFGDFHGNTLEMLRRGYDVHLHFADFGIRRLMFRLPGGFSSDDEIALGRFTRMWGDAGHDLQLALLGIGDPAGFGGHNEKQGQSWTLATSTTWVFRTPFIPTRHLKLRLSKTEQRDPQLVRSATERELVALIRLELSRRPAFRAVSDDVLIEPLLDAPGTQLGGTFTSWLKFTRLRSHGGGHQSTSHGYGFRLTFRAPVTGPIALGYGCHFGLGLFQAGHREAAVKGRKP